jgi:single-strand DNA-binding protein
MNVCTFSGRLTKDATEFVTRTGTSIANFTLAIDSGFGENKKTLFLNCKAFKRGGMIPYMTKGKAFIVSGELQPNEYTDKNGNEIRTMELICGQIDFQQGDSGNNQQKSSQSQNNYNSNPGPAFPSESEDLDSIPF